MKRTYRLLRVCCFATLIGTPFLTNAQQQDSITPNNIIVLEKGLSVPEKAKKLGSIKMGDAMRFNCGFDKTLEALKEKAAEKHGNLISITEIKKPDVWSTCYRMKADVYYIHDTTGLRYLARAKSDSITRSLIPEDAQYALLYIYRPPAFSGSIISYTTHIDTAEVRMKNGSAYIIKILKEGPLTVWARTESKKELKLDIKFGQVYFVRCAINMGAFVGVPYLSLNSNIAKAYQEFRETAPAEQEAQTSRNKEDDVYIKSNEK